MSNRLQDKVAVITGAASGIGAACARRFAAEGASLVVSDLSEAACTGIANELEEAGAALAVVAGDVSSRPDTEAIAEAARATFGRIDVFVNSAGISERTVADLPDLEARWRRVIDVNLKGTMLMCMVPLTDDSVSGPAGCSRGWYRAATSRSPAPRPREGGGPLPARRRSPPDRSLRRRREG